MNKLLRKLKWAGLLAVCAAVLLLDLKIGSVSITWLQMAQWLREGLLGRATDLSDGAATIFFMIRMPRVIMAATVGALLAAVGAALQSIFRNPLSDPYLLGVSSGAALGAVFGLSLGMFFPAPLACLGAVLSLGIVLMMSREGSGVSVSMMVLTGAAVHSLSSAILTLMLSRLSGRYESAGIFFWLLGSLSTLPYRILVPIVCLSAAGLAFLMVWAPALNLLAQGEETAGTLGLPVGRVKWILLLLCALLTGLAVTFNGMIPFVGLVVPHMTRLLTGPDHRKVLPLSALMGAVLVATADAVGRTVMAPQEIPTGVVTALIGAPFFLYILRRERRKLS